MYNDAAEKKSGNLGRLIGLQGDVRSKVSLGDKKSMLVPNGRTAGGGPSPCRRAQET